MGYPDFCIHLDTKTRIDLNHSSQDYPYLRIIWKLGNTFTYEFLTVNGKEFVGTTPGKTSPGD
jgi:hypothetical protein